MRVWLIVFTDRVTEAYAFSTEAKRDAYYDKCLAQGCDASIMHKLSPGLDFYA